MPHCIIEYSQELDAVTSQEQLVQSVHSAATASELFSPGDIKTRTLPYTHYRVGDEQHLFIHITLKILSGRTTSQKKMLTQCVTESILSLSLPQQVGTPVAFTCEVLDIDRDSYAKSVLT